MNTNINFGKIIKINAPYDAAEQIAFIANGYRTKNTKLNRDIKKLFPDIKAGRAYPYSDSDNTSYIFSGIEGKKFLDSQNQAQFEIDYFSDILNEEQRLIQETASTEFHKDRVKQIISSAKLKEVNVDYDTKYKLVKGINIIV